MEDSFLTNKENTNFKNNSNPIDVIYLKRKQKSFRYFVSFILLLTCCLWFSDRYLQFDLDETKYRIALTLENESARPIMRNIAKKYFASPELRNDPRYFQYLEFLASIEEEDEVIKLYEQIYKQEAYNASFLLNYGCRLYLTGNYEQAQRIFKEAEAIPPNNSLPGYLESATVFNPKTKDEISLEHSISIVAKENRSDHPIIFPKPFWHPTLPLNTYLFYSRREECISRCISLIYTFYNDVLTQIGTNGKQNNGQNKRIYLEEIYSMGKKIGSSIRNNPEYSLTLAILSLKIQKDTLDLYNKLGDKYKSDFLNNELKKLPTITSFLETYQDYEDKRREEFEQARNNRIKLLWLILSGFIEIFILLILIKLLSIFPKRLKKLSNLNIYSLNLPYILLTCWVFITFSFMLYFSYFDNLINKNSNFLTYFWYSFLSLPFVVSPIFSIKWVKNGKKIPSCEQDNELSYKKSKHIQQIRFITGFILFIERLSGILLGLYIFTVSIWFLIFRLIFQSYPYQLNLVTDKFSNEEAKLISQFLSFFYS